MPRLGTTEREAVNINITASTTWSQSRYSDPVQEKLQRSLEQRMAIKFCVKLEKSAAETIPMLKKAFGTSPQHGLAQSPPRETAVVVVVASDDNNRSGLPFTREVAAISRAGEQTRNSVAAGGFRRFLSFAMRHGIHILF
ncbi:hypothetical protein NQ318_009199 [Aromia moschata]|uniref:Uncharacterized protein n=1 Tax=Aromia moschata TaxID=1265417 RepID=A0AAV8Y3S0_9CUCU|nr:hypothetical protein NQ318_009199 [Aromia moschata]